MSIEKIGGKKFEESQITKLKYMFNFLHGQFEQLTLYYIILKL